jgi:protein-S-isoprenylcysteine O-methyltransferase Ste14
MSNNYGQWAMVAFDVALVGWGARGLFHPRSRSDWGVLGGMWAFLVALYAEMYGFPLTVYLLEGPLGSRFPQIRPTFAGGHIWNDLIGWRGTPQLSPFHLTSYVLLVGGFWLTGAGWAALSRATRAGTLATDGPYARMRHPQYAGFTLIMAGFLLQWPTIPTLVMFPFLVLAYRRLARREEHEQAARFGIEWDAYAAAVRRWRARLRPLPVPLVVTVGWARMTRRQRPGHGNDRASPDAAASSGERSATLLSEAEQPLADQGVTAEREQEHPAGPGLEHCDQGPGTDGERGLVGDPPDAQVTVGGPNPSP